MKVTRFAFALVIVLAFSSIAPADEEEKYAHPSGEDPWGTIYAVTGEPSEITEALEEDGQYILPSFINSTVIKDGQEYWVINQVPAAGTVYTCPQSVVV